MAAQADNGLACIIYPNGRLIRRKPQKPCQMAVIQRIVKKLLANYEQIFIPFTTQARYGQVGGWRVAVKLWKNQPVMAFDDLRCCF